MDVPDFCCWNAATHVCFVIAVFITRAALQTWLFIIVLELTGF